MKTFNEWQNSTNHEDSELLLKNVNDLVRQIKLELESFQGERFEGFLNLIGSLRGLQTTLSEIEMGVETPKWQSQ